MQDPRQAAEKDREVQALLDEAMRGRTQKTVGCYTHDTVGNTTVHAIKVYEARKKGK